MQTQVASINKVKMGGINEAYIVIFWVSTLLYVYLGRLLYSVTLFMNQEENFWGRKFIMVGLWQARRRVLFYFLSACVLTNFFVHKVGTSFSSDGTNDKGIVSKSRIGIHSH